MSKKLKLTPWFPGDVKPAYIGGYTYKYTHGYEFDAWWDGSRWLINDKHYPSFRGNVISAGSARESWRGLAMNPARSKT